ncbi:hypothetical protein MRB53_006453 [Persea americana]|uniref:Uncharacterized protein n=1 Tax=Persea americana TaxID=3435 RepID=A0ACC2MH04_PERAE|nr:hypothetical protein MRB53_006453 [Persea americana]|eukprot:TRINITY_DN8179_c0_g1_i1.p1 TRINITY_DN8179_c0_g1~~TRINITY_DN8179_c0_g1_i1.p1  ORF type:complete len:331 (-),score=59.19 TRINITY_DN8179_c0_g1_i1:576-1568(-)
MAQAARLNLRMQKEMKLLLTDPPPGVSLSHNDSTSSDAISLSTIDARLQGPEGTVYEKGVFNIKIQIPERYPFQPPIVTFGTPIYHPNIDSGGRICLDILNLPPKGAWQPSLNISTVLTSIGLLLSEPNPDDGLMCDASREYKYNRQVFDQKARSWTEKYAMRGAGCTSGGALLCQSMMEAGQGDTGLGSAVDHEGGRKRLRGLSSKLSLDSSVPLERSNANKENVAITDNKENVVPVRRLSLLNSQRLPQRPSVDTPKSSSSPLSSNHDKQKPLQDHNRPAANASLKQTELVSEIPPTVIVSDSEESDDEDKSSTRSRLSLLRKRLIQG